MGREEPVSANRLHPGLPPFADVLTEEGTHTRTGMSFPSRVGKPQVHDGGEGHLATLSFDGVDNLARDEDAVPPSARGFGEDAHGNELVDVELGGARRHSQ